MNRHLKLAEGRTALRMLQLLTWKRWNWSLEHVRTRVQFPWWLSSAICPIGLHRCASALPTTTAHFSPVFAQNSPLIIADDIPLSRFGRSPVIEPVSRQCRRSRWLICHHTQHPDLQGYIGTQMQPHPRDCLEPPCIRCKGTLRLQQACSTKLQPNPSTCSGHLLNSTQCPHSHPRMHMHTMEPSLCLRSTMLRLLSGRGHLG